jgi:transcriptional regulator with XRE-family HTH domain
MKSLKSRIAEKFKDEAFEKNYHRNVALYRLADEVLLLRRQRGLTQKELAAKVGTTQAVISRLESASVKPSFETILKIAAALDAALNVQLLPIETTRRREAEGEAETEKVDPLKGIVYFDFTKLPVENELSWISPKNAPIEEVFARPSRKKVSPRIKIREYA